MNIYIYINLERGRAEQNVGGLGHISRVQTIVERILLDVVILEGRHVVEERLGQYAHCLEQITAFEDCVRDTGQWPIVAQIA